MEEQRVAAEAEKLPEVVEDPNNEKLGEDEPKPQPPKKRKRDPSDTGDKGQAPDGHEAPKLPKEEGGPSELKKIREMKPTDREGLLEIMGKFKDTVTNHAKKLLECFTADQSDRAERVRNLMAQQEKLTPEDWLSQLSNMTVYLLHMAGLHNKLVDNVLLHMGIVMEDLAPTIEDSIKVYEELTATTKHLCAIIHENTK